MTFKEFLQLEGSEKSGNRRPTPQRRILPQMGIARAPVMPARSIPDHDPIQPELKPVRPGTELFLIPKPKNIVGIIKKPSDRSITPATRAGACST